MGEVIARSGPEITGVLELAPDEVTDLDGGYVHVGWTDIFPMETGEPVDPGLVYGATNPLSRLHDLAEEARTGMEKVKEGLRQLQSPVTPDTEV